MLLCCRSSRTKAKGRKTLQRQQQPTSSQSLCSIKPTATTISLNCLTKHPPVTTKCGSNSDKLFGLGSEWRGDEEEEDEEEEGGGGKHVPQTGEGVMGEGEDVMGEGVVEEVGRVKDTLKHSNLDQWEREKGHSSSEQSETSSHPLKDVTNVIERDSPPPWREKSSYSEDTAAAEHGTIDAVVNVHVYDVTLGTM